MNRCILLTRPNHDRTTRYISSWVEDVISLAKSKGDKVLDLKNNKASKRETEGRLKKQKPSFVFLIGHGDETQITGQDNKELIKAGVNEDVLIGTITYGLSCKAATILGHEAVRSGAKAFIGYIDDFIFIYDESVRTHPKDDKIAGHFFEPSNQVAISLIKDQTAGEAYRRSQKAFSKNITELLNSESSEKETAAIPWLFWDMQNQVCLGDTDSKIS